MTDETQGAAQADSEDTAAVLAHAALEGDKTFLRDPNDTAGQPEVEGEEAEDPGEETAATEPEAKPEKVKLTAQQRVQQAVARQREAERDRDFYRDQALARQAPEKPAQEAQPTGDGRPDPADYEGGIYDPVFVQRNTEFTVNQAVAAALAERDGRQSISTKVSAFESKVAELFPDGEPDGLKAFRALPSLPQGVSDVLLASDIAPKLAEHLGDNPNELARLSGLSPALQARELTLIESRLATPAKPPPKTATDAPEPAPQARGSGGQFKVAGDTDDFEAFERQHMPGR